MAPLIHLAILYIRDVLLHKGMSKPYHVKTIEVKENYHRLTHDSVAFQHFTCGRLMVEKTYEGTVSGGLTKQG
jgi:hypothetical protein